MKTAAEGVAGPIASVRYEGEFASSQVGQNDNRLEPVRHVDVRAKVLQRLRMGESPQDSIDDVGRENDFEDQ